MEVFEINENKEPSIHLVDFPFICRVCLMRGDLRSFEEEDYLLDLFVTITKIDVRSTFCYPRNICNECINKLEDISLFIDIAKYNDARQENNLTLKKVKGEVDTVDGGMGKEHLVKTEEYEEGINNERSKICQICSLSNCLTPFEEKAHLMQLFQNITNINVKAESKFLTRYSICNKCFKELENLSFFVSLSLCNDKKLKNTIERNEALKTGDNLEENVIEMSSSKCIDLKLESIPIGNEMNIGNYSDESTWYYESKALHSMVDIKEDILSTPEYSFMQNYQNRLEFCSDTNFIEKLIDCDPRENKFSTNHHNIILKELVVNLEANFGSNQFKSEFCKKRSFKNYFHQRGNYFKCDYCQKKFIHRKNLKSHLLTHTGEKPYKCDYCKKSFTRRDNLKNHLLTHTAEKSYKCDCCTKCFTHKHHLKSHLLTHTEVKETFNCDSCGKSFNRKDYFKNHLLTHSGKKPYKCHCCKKSFSQKSILKHHMKTHSGEKPFKCDCCEKSFTHKHHFKCHLLTHTGEKPFHCDLCKTNFTSKHGLKKHLPIHAREKPFKCRWCGESFTCNQLLKTHLITHSEQYPFKCYCCEKGFTHKLRLQKHMRTHTGEKPFKCDFCKANFTSKSGLKCHLLIHTEDKPFKCAHCEKSFTHKHHIIGHLLTHTRDKTI